MEELHKNNPVEKLQQELAERGKYYFKGFGALLQGVISDLDYFEGFEATPRVEARIWENLNRITELYKSIPFDKITNHPDYDLLSEIKQLVERLALVVEDTLKNKKSIQESQEIIEAIAKKGNEYKARLIALKKKLNLQPNHEKDGLQVVDIDGIVWTHPF